MNNGASSYRRFLDGDDSGLKEIIEEFRIPLQLFLTSFTGDPETAEEATVDTFVRLAVKKPRYKEKAAFKTWLFTVGRNIAADEMRKRGKQKEIPVEESENSAALPDNDPELIVIRDEQNRQLYASMKKLKREYYSALYLRYFEQLTVKEIASVMGKNEGNAKTLLSRARNALKEQLEKDGYEYDIG